MKDELSQSSIYILFVAVFLGLMGLGIIIPLLPIFVNDLGASSFWVGALFAGYGLSRIIVTPLFGKYSESHGRKWFITGGLALYAVVSILYIFAGSIYELFTIRFVHGIASAMIGPMAMAYIGDITPKGQEGKYQGRLSIAFYLGLGSGPLIGGVLYNYFGMDSVFYLMAFMALIPCLLCIKYLPESRPSGRTKQIKIRHAFVHPRVQAILFFRFVNTLPYGAFMVFLPVLTATDDHFSTSLTGMIVAAEILSMGICQGYFGALADRYKKSWLIVIGTLIVAFATLALPLMRDIWAILAIAVLIGVGNAMAISAATAVAAMDGREIGQGVVMGAFNTVTSLGVTFPPLIFGVVLVAMGVDAIFIISAVLTLVALPVFWFLVIRSRKWIKARSNE